MSKDKATNKPPARKSRDPEERIRLLATRDEIIETKLTQLQIDEMQRENMVLDNEIEKIEEKKKESASNFASQLKTIELQKSELRRMVNSGRRRETVTIEEYLNGRNEVVRIRKDTGEPLRKDNGEPVTRTATARELQEEMFTDKRTDADPAGPVPQNDAQDHKPPGDASFPSEFGGEPG
jgi:hypothetical protein